MSNNDTRPLVSIVIPHYNRAELLAETLRSVEAQEYPHWEVIVVDDGSEPDQWTAIQRYAKQGISILERTDGLKGPSRCRNLGAAAARGEYLVFLDSDDLLAPWCLAQRVEIAQAEPQADLWIFQVLLFRERPGDMDVCWNRLAGDDDLERFLRSDPPWHTSSPIWRKESLLALGGFNEKVIYGDDADLHMRALLGGLAVAKRPAELPDAFVRRGATERITNRWTPALIESRRSRLEEGTRALLGASAPLTLQHLWEGQYFVESEELLFNVHKPMPVIGKIIDAWVTCYRPALLRRWIVRAYFQASSMCHDHAYLFLRIMRRLAILLLPTEYFPRGGYFHVWQITEQQASEIRQNFRLPPRASYVETTEQ